MAITPYENLDMRWLPYLTIAIVQARYQQELPNADVDSEALGQAFLVTQCNFRIRRSEPDWNCIVRRSLAPWEADDLRGGMNQLKALVDGPAAWSSISGAIPYGSS